MKYLSLLFLIGFILGEKYDVQTGSSNESFQAKGLKLKVIEELAVKNVKRGARKWILYPSTAMLTGIPTAEIFFGVGGKIFEHVGLDFIDIYESEYRAGIVIATVSLTMSYLLLKKWDKLHKPPAHWTYSDKEIYMSIYEEKYEKFKKRRLLYSSLGIPIAIGIIATIFVLSFELDGYSAGSGVGAF
mgnify:CR=1 FL=1